MKKTIFIILALLYGCSTSSWNKRDRIVKSCNGYKEYRLYPLFPPGYVEYWRSRRLGYSERIKKENDFIASERINANPTLSCFKSIHSVNFVGCYDSALFGFPGIPPLLNVQRWEKPLSISEHAYKEVLEYAYNVSGFKMVYSTKCAKIPSNYRVALCYKTWRDVEIPVVSIIFVNDKRVERGNKLSTIE